MPESSSVYINKEEREMKSESNRVFWRGAMVLITNVFALMMLASGSAALAGDDDDDDDGKRITVSGNSTFSDCGLPASDFALDMTGDLVGCLTIHAKSFKCEKLNGFDKYTERGKEHFDGTIKGVGSGTFKTKYIVEGVYATGFCDLLDSDPNAFAKQLAGGCDHKVKGKRGDLKDLSGLIKFYDIIPGIAAGGVGIPSIGASNFLYEGDLKIDD